MLREILLAGESEETVYDSISETVNPQDGVTFWVSATRSPNSFKVSFEYHLSVVDHERADEIIANTIEFYNSKKGFRDGNSK